MTEAVVEGGCHCKAVRFQARGAPRFVARCHCDSCRRTTGAAFSTWVGFKDEQVVWTGARAIYESSKGARRGFCQNCGAPLSFEGDKWAGETHLLIGTFDDPRVFVPTVDVFAEEALSWCAPDPQPEH